MSPTVQAPGAELEYAEHGAGQAVLLVHGMAADRHALAPLAAEIAATSAGARAIVYSRRGYGASGAPEPYAGTTVAEQAEDAVAVLHVLDAAPAIVLGEDFGALVALDLLLRHGGLVSGAVLADPPLFALVPDAARELAEWNEALREAVADGGPAAGVERWLAGRADEDTLARAVAAHAAFFADVAGLASLPVTRAGLRGIGQEIVVVTGPGSSPATVAAADALSDLAPRARRAVDGDVAGAAVALLGERAA